MQDLEFLASKVEMTWNEIVSKYPRQWVAIKKSGAREEIGVKDGVVVSHCSDDRLLEMVKGIKARGIHVYLVSTFESSCIGGDCDI